MSGVETVITVLVIMAYSVGRQMGGEPLRIKRLIGLPAALTVMAIIDVANSKGAGPTRLDIVLIVIGCAVNVAIGMCQGRQMRLESCNGYLWGQMPKSGLWWWGAKIVSGVVLDGIGHAFGAGIAVTSAVMLLRLALNRLGQAAIVTPRSLATGIPFAPEPTKKNPGAARTGPFFSATGRLLAGIRERTSTVFDPVRPDLPRYVPVQQPDVRLTTDEPPGYRTGSVGPFAGPTTPPTSLER